MVKYKGDSPKGLLQTVPKIRKLYSRNARLQTYHKWTAQEIKKLVELVNLEPSLSYAQIALALGRSADAIRVRIYKYGLTKKNPRQTHSQKLWSDEEKEILRKEWYLGTPTDEIALKLGRTAPAIRAYSKKYNLPSRRTILNQTKEIVELYCGGMTLKELAAKYGVSKSTIQRRVSSRRRCSTGQLTEAEKDVIEERFAEGCTLECIARRIGRRSLITIGNYIKTAELEREEKDSDTAIADLYRHGLDIHQISIKTSLPFQVVRNRAKKLGLIK